MTEDLFYLLLNFIKKYLFILKAAADGWRIRYIGGNQFEFYASVNHANEFPDTHAFVNKYISKLPFRFN